MGREGPFMRADAGIRVQRQNQHIAQRAGLFQQPDVAGMEQVVAAVGEDYRFAFQPPARALFAEFRTIIESSHETPV